MTNEKISKYQYSHSLSSFIVQFPSPQEGQIIPSSYPGYNWHNYSETVADVDGLVSKLREKKPNLMGMDLFNAVAEIVKIKPSFQGRTSHLLLSLFNRGYFGDGDGLVQTGLDNEIRDTDTGQPVNPTFKENQTDLPANLQIRKAIIDAIVSDKIYQEGIVSGNVAAVKDLSRQRADWYQSLFKNMSDRAQIQPAEYPLM